MRTVIISGISLTYTFIQLTLYGILFLIRITSDTLIGLLPLIASIILVIKYSQWFAFLIPVSLVILAQFCMNTRFKQNP